MHGLSQALAALIGAIAGGLLSAVASWFSQRVQTRAQWLSQEVQRRQDLYSEFIEAAARCYGEALGRDAPAADGLARLYGAIGRMRLQSSEAVLEEASRVAQTILATYRQANRDAGQIRDFLAENSVDLFSEFGRRCRTELAALRRTP